METERVKPDTKIQVPITKGSAILGDLKYLQMSDLILDPKNVRFKHVDTSLNDKDIERWIWDEADTKRLLQEIRFSGGLSEKPFAKEVDHGTYHVIEGNRRIVCLRKLSEDIKSGKEKEIPLSKIDPVQCFVFPKDTSDKNIAIFLARIHVSGKKDWVALNQSAHVYDLISKHDYSYDDIADAISISKTKVTQMKKAYDATLKYSEKHPDDHLWLRRYSHFEELYKKKHLRDWADDTSNLELFMKWIYNNQFPMAIKVRKLEKIIQDGKDAYRSLKEGKTIDDAVKILQQQEPKRTISAKIADEVEDKVGEFQELLQNFPRGKMKEAAINKEKLKRLERLYADLGQIIRDIKNLSQN